MNSRHANRDIVLTHVKGHYLDAGIAIEDNPAPHTSALLSSPPSDLASLVGGNNTASSYMSEMLSKIPLPLIAAMNPQLTATTTSPIRNALQTPSPVKIPSAAPFDMTIGDRKLEIPAPHGQIAAATVMATPMATTPQSSATTTEHGEVDEASSVGTTVSSGWRDPAPYRCGHCHQVSNWKHVIQVLLLTTHYSFF